MLKDPNKWKYHVHEMEHSVMKKIQLFLSRFNEIPIEMPVVCVHVCDLPF